MANDYPANWPEISLAVKTMALWKCRRCRRSHDVASGYVLTVHHLDGDKANCEWWNLAALCQRCHLKIQARVNMNQMFMFGHSAWMKPFVEGRAKSKGRRIAGGAEEKT